MGITKESTTQKREIYKKNSVVKRAAVQP